MTNRMTETAPMQRQEASPADHLAAGELPAPTGKFNATELTNRMILHTLSALRNGAPIEHPGYPAGSERAMPADLPEIWHWLKNQGIVSGSIESGKLTLAGRASLDFVDRHHAARASNSGGEVSATEFVLTLLRHHFHAGAEHMA